MRKNQLYEGTGVSNQIMICRQHNFLARVLDMLLSFNQKNGAHICCCMCCAQVSSGIVRLLI